MFTAGLLRCTELMGLGFFSFPKPSPVELWSWQVKLNRGAWCCVVHRTISRLKCDCFNTLIHLSLAFRMLKKLPNYFSALYSDRLKGSRDSFCQKTDLFLMKKKIAQLS